MCGIAGILQLDRSRAAPAGVLEEMLRAIVHRGPDEDGRLVDDELAMGMRRLSIIDLQDGQQPIFDEQRRFGVVFNGEIYNYRELRTELEQRGHVFRTRSDTEVIVHLFEEHGSQCVDFLRGMFGLAVWDNQTRSLFLARDRLGIKPLYYTLQGDTLIFGSEIKAVLRHPGVTAQLDHRALGQYLSLKYVPAPRTMFEGILSLPPGHTLHARDGQCHIERYWNVSYATEGDDRSEDQRSEDDCRQQLADLLRESVGLRLRSDVPFGAFLSGGVDSSTIVALMAEQMSEPVKTFSVGFDGGGEADELPYARQVAERFGCEHHTLVVTASDFLRDAEDVLWHLDQPIADQATVATHMVAKLARRHVKMVLTGEGGDELFAGYARYQGEQFAKWFRPLPSWARRGLRRVSRQLPGLRRAKIALNALTIRDEAERMANWFPMFTDETRAQVLRPEHHLSAGDTADVFAEHLKDCDAVSSLDRMLYVDSKLWLADYLLLRGDKLTMANSLEARVPLLDHRLVEFAAGLPEHYKLRGKTRKYLLKQVAAELIPDDIIHRKKQGFPIPIERWLRAEARPLMRDLLDSATFRDRGLFETAAVETLMGRHESSYADHSTELWGLMSLEMWLRKFVDHPLATCATPAPTQTQEVTLG